MSGAPRPSTDFDRVILDDRVGEELPAHVFDPGAPRCGIAVGQFEFDELPLADLADPVEPEPLQGVADRLPLRVEYAGLEGDVNACLHPPDPCGDFLTASSSAP